MKIFEQNPTTSQPNIPKNQMFQPNSIFQNLLNQATDKTLSDKQKVPIQPLHEPIPTNLHYDIRSFDNAIPKQLNNIFDLLDNYTSDLKNPSKTLREIEPRLNSILDMALLIDEEYQQDTTNDDTLTEIINQLLVTVRLEQFKMQRGDYLNEI